MRLTAVLAAAAMLGGMLAGCGSNDSSKSGKGETGKVQQNEDIAKFIYQVTDSFDTSINYIAASWVTYGVAETLFEVDEEGNAVPLLADSMEMKDDLHWTLKLKEGIKFHDGTPFNADAVLFTFDRLAATGEIGGNFDFIVSMDKKDDYTIEITTTEAYGAFVVFKIIICV